MSYDMILISKGGLNMKKYILNLIPFMMAFGCLLAFNIIGCEVTPDGTLIEPFFLIPVAWLFIFVGIIGLIIRAIKGRQNHNSEKNFLSQFLYGLCILGLIVLTGVMIGLPWLLPAVLKYTTFYGVEHYKSFLVLLYLTGIPAWMILWCTKGLAKNIMARTPFSKSSQKQLKGISLCAFIIFVGYVIAAFVIGPSMSVLIIVIGAFMVTLIGAILYRLVQLAIEIQEENELTI